VKFYQVVVLIVAALTFLFLGSFFFGIGFHLYAVEDLLEDLAELYHHSILMSACGVFFVVMGYLASVKYLIKGLFREDGMLFYGPDRSNAISYVALEDLVRKTALRFSEVKKCRVKLRTLKKKVQVWVTLHLWVGYSVQESVDQIRSEMQSKFQSILGSDEHLEFVIRVLRVEERKQTEMQFQKKEHN